MFLLSRGGGHWHGGSIGMGGGVVGTGSGKKPTFRTARAHTRCAPVIDRFVTKTMSYAVACLMRLQYISYRIKLGTELIQSLCPL